MGSQTMKSLENDEVINFRSPYLFGVAKLKVSTNAAIPVSKKDFAE